MFEPLPAKPDHVALEVETLERWNRERTFERLRGQNRGNERWSFIDGPITANNPMGVHHAWGRTLKDAFQRYKAMRGFDLRYQNGFDCQGLWVEVEVEKALGLNSKRQIEEYGLAEFAARCKERVARYAEYVLREDGTWVARALDPDATAVRTATGSELVGLEYEGPFDDLPAPQGIVHRVIPWDDVALDEGTGVVHIAPGAGTEDFELSRIHQLPVLVPIDEAGRMLPEFGFAGLTTDEAEQPIIDQLERRGLLLSAGRIVHRYPTCWRCGTPLLFRVVDDWFISAGEIRRRMLEENATVEWTPSHYGKRMDDWLRNMGDWNISRKRYFGLPLPFYPCSCGHLNVIGSRAELEERATGGLDQLQELHRTWIDEVGIRCEACGEEARRIPEVGDAWLDAGIVPFSTLGWQNDEWVPKGYATGASEGLSGADLPDHAYWEQWFPAGWISEMREQIRLWFYSQSFMSVTLVDRTPYQRVLTYEKLLDETGREMHRSWGNSIEANEALERMGADVMRWQFSEQNPGQNIRFGYGPANDVKRRLLTLWNSAKFLVDYGTIAAFKPRYSDLETTPEGDLEPLDRW